MRELRALRLRVLFFAMAASLAFGIAIESAVLGMVALFVGCATWWVTGGGSRRRLPTVMAVVLAVLIVLVSVAVWVSPQGRESPPTRVGIAIMGLGLVRLLTRQTLADERQILLTGGVLIVVAAIESNDLLVGVCVLAACALAIDAAIRYQIASVALDHAVVADAGRGWFGSSSAAVGASPQYALRRTIVLAVTLSLLIGSLLFIVFPRTPSPNRSLFGLGVSDRSGFVQQVSLTKPRRIELSSEEVMSVEWLGPDGKPAIVPGALRLRGQVLERYDDRSMEWRPRERIQSMSVLSEGGEWTSLAASPIDERVNTFTLRVSMKGDAIGIVFSAWLPIALRSPTAQVFMLDPRTATVRVLDLDSAVDLRTYETRVQPFPAPPALFSVLRPPDAPARVPSFPVRAVVEFADRLLAEADEPLPLSATVLQQAESERWARNLRVARLFADDLASDRYRYTTDLREFLPIEGRDMIDLFLTHYRFGHCEYFASALAALCRAAGVDARVVTGFLVDDQSPRDGVYTVRSSHAHAWVEVRTGRAMWTVVDPTPPARGSRARAERSSWARSLAWVFTPLEDLWRREVARFDAAAQSSLFARWSARARELIHEGTDAVLTLARGTESSGSIGPTAWTWGGSVVVFCGLSVAIAVLLRRRRRRAKAALGLARRDRARARSALRDGAFYVEALEALSTGGHARTAGSTPRDFQRTVSAQNAAAGEVFERVVDRFYEIRFGARRPDPKRRAADLALVDELRVALAHRR